MKLVKVTYYLEVISSWCFWAEPAWAQLKEEYSELAEFQWKIALMDPTGLPISKEQLEWFYRRSGTITRSPRMLNPGWFEPGRAEYLAPNLVAEAAKDFGIVDDTVRLAIARAGLIEGRKVGDWKESLKIAATEADLNLEKLSAKAQSEEILKRARATTQEFHDLKVTQRPTFLLESNIGDRAVFSGIASADPLVATIENMLSDAIAYQSHAAHFGSPPPK